MGEPGLVITLFSTLFVALALSFYLLVRSHHSSRGQVQEKLDSIRKEMSDELSRSSLQFSQQMANLVQQVQLLSGQMGQRLDHTYDLVGAVQRNLGAVSIAAEKVHEVGKSISTLHEILRAPKLRGSIGEMLLAELLSQVLPASSYTLQHRFKSGETVDALIHLGQGGIAIDSKFPLENFRKMGDSSLAEEEKKGFQRKFVQDVRRHIDAISGKYIVPDEGTIDFAFMYIPAENVYYEIIIKEEGTGAGTALSDYSMAKRVIPVSPNSFYAYLQSVLLGLRGFHLEKSSRKMLDYLSRLRVDYARFRDDFEILGRHLNHARIKYEESERRSERFHDRLNELEIPLQPASETDPVVKGLDQAESL